MYCRTIFIIRKLFLLLPNGCLPICQCSATCKLFPHCPSRVMILTKFIPPLHGNRGISPHCRHVCNSSLPGWSPPGSAAPAPPHRLLSIFFCPAHAWSLSFWSMSRRHFFFCHPVHLLFSSLSLHYPLNRFPAKFFYSFFIYIFVQPPRG